MASKLLNEIFYPDITNIILDYIMINIIDVKRNKLKALIYFIGCWNNHKRWGDYVNNRKRLGDYVEYGASMFLADMYDDHPVFKKRYKTKKTFKLK